jgi:Cytochrome c
MVRTLQRLLALPFVLFGFGYFVQANDERESMRLLVNTLASLESEPEICCSLMRGMLSGLEGRRNVAPPEGWSELSNKFSTSQHENVRELSMQLSQWFGDQEARQKAIALVMDTSASDVQRRATFGRLLSQQCVELPEILETLLNDPAMELDAIRGYSVVAVDAAPELLLARYPRLKAELRRAVIETLATRKDYAEALAAAIESKDIARDDVPVHVARSLTDILGKRFTRVYGDVRPIAEDRERLLAKYKAMITPEALSGADPSRGRVVFQKTCAACHQLYGEGGLVGPDLTGSNRANLDYTLLNSVDPSYDVPDSYKMVQILTVEGRVINGVLAEEDAVRVVLKPAAYRPNR